MARNQTAVVNWSQYLALRGVAGFMRCFDLDQMLAAAARLGSTYYKCSAKRRDRAHENLSLSFPEWTDEQIAATAEKSVQYMVQLFMVEALVVPRLITPSSWPRYITTGAVKDVIDDIQRGRPMILISGHCGNWELTGYFLSMIGYPIHAIGRPIDNPLINSYLTDIREARGMTMIPKWGATSELQRILRNNGRIGVIADQNAGDQGMFVPFFGRLASSYKSIGLLAMRYDAPIVVGAAQRTGEKMQYRIYCEDYIRPEDWTDQPDPLYYITARYNRALEQIIRRAPEQYLWLHRRWKSRPRHERLGRPLPRKLREQIEQLPWMTQLELDRIVADTELAATEKAAQSRD